MIPRKCPHKTPSQLCILRPSYSPVLVGRNATLLGQGAGQCTTKKENWGYLLLKSPKIKCCTLTIQQPQLTMDHEVKLFWNRISCIWYIILIDLTFFFTLLLGAKKQLSRVQVMQFNLACKNLEGSNNLTEFWLFCSKSLQPWWSYFGTNSRIFRL